MNERKVTEPSPTPAANALNFNSAEIGTKTAKKTDPFAAQNQQAALEKQQQTKRRNRGLIIGAIVLGIVAIVAVVIVIIVFANRPVMTPAEENEKTATEIFNQAIDSVNSITSSANTTGGSSVDTTSEATTIFENAIQEADNSNNQGLVDALRVAQIRLYINTGGHNEKIIEIGETIDPNNIDTAAKSELYNFMALAYEASGNNEKAAEYYRMSAEISTEIDNYGE